MHDTLVRRAATAVCHGCRTRVPAAARPLRDRLPSQSRGFSSPATAPPAPPPAAGFTALPSRQLLSLSGPDAAKFLQGLVTSNVLAKDGVPRADPFYTAFLNATGRVLHDVFVYPYQKGPGLPDGTSPDRAYLLEMDAGQSATLRSYLRRYKLRSKIALQPLTPDDATVWQMWDDAAPTDPSSDAPSSSALATNDSRIVFRDPRAPGLGHRLIHFGDNTGTPPPELDGSMEQSTEDAYTIRRYLRGVPEGQGEILREQALPQESNMDVMRAIDWHKGCYVGQELTIRTRHRGVVRKRVLPCVVYAADEPIPAALAYDPSPPKGGAAAGHVPTETSIERCGRASRSRSRPVGKWLKGVGNIGLALCRLETMTDLTLPGEQAAQSFNPDSEFDMEWGAEEDGLSSVKVKAFVPDWHRVALS